MKNIGKYNGIPCYECLYQEYVSTYDRGFDNGAQIFIIDGVMVKKNTIIGYYDGRVVKDVYNGETFLKNEMKTQSKNEMKNESKNDNVMEFNKQKKASVTADNSKWNEVKAKQEGQMTEVSYEELVKQDIDFGKYSTVVDQFFALLEV